MQLFNKVIFGPSYCRLAWVMLNSTCLALKHFPLLKECPSVSNTLCYSSVMTFWGSSKVSLGRWYKFTLNLCYSVLKQFPCTCKQFAECAGGRHLLITFLRKRDFCITNACMFHCIWDYDSQLGKLLKLSLSKHIKISINGWTQRS